ncbi:MAG: hypothetical protein Q9M23_03860, partial [Mariprofundaceae bacterium]|nr:hypothetical protein [Mariprofundaceae bacterium]
MLLPGGIADAQGVQRDFLFKPLTGGVELAMADLSRGTRNHPAMVTAMLSAAVASVGDSAVSREQV